MGVLANGANACRANIKPTGQWAGQWPPGARGLETHASASPHDPDAYPQAHISVHATYPSACAERGA